MTASLTDADVCRRNGWGPGTRLVGDEGDGPVVIRVTAVGERRILAVVESIRGEPVEDAHEAPWTLNVRRWTTITDGGYERTTETHPWDRPPVEHLGWIYDARARQVYWNSTYPACRAKGPRRAECLLTPNHEGDHYGNGYDRYGPFGPQRWPRRSSDTTTNPRKA